MKTPVHKVTLMVVDHDLLGPDGVKEVLETTRFANRCMNPRVMDVQTRAVEWDDKHPINQTKTFAHAFEDLFSIKPESEDGLLFEVGRLVADRRNGDMTKHEFEVMLSELVRAAGL